MVKKWIVVLVFVVFVHPGSLKVVGYIGGKPVSEKEIRTAGAPARIRLIPDRAEIAADGMDLSYPYTGKGEK